VLRPWGRPGEEFLFEAPLKFVLLLFELLLHRGFGFDLTRVVAAVAIASSVTGIGICVGHDVHPFFFTHSNVSFKGVRKWYSRVRLECNLLAGY